MRMQEKERNVNAEFHGQTNPRTVSCWANIVQIIVCAIHDVRYLNQNKPVERRRKRGNFIVSFSFQGNRMRSRRKKEKYIRIFIYLFFPL